RFLDRIRETAILRGGRLRLRIADRSADEDRGFLVVEGHELRSLNDARPVVLLEEVQGIGRLREVERSPRDGVMRLRGREARRQALRVRDDAAVPAPSPDAERQ